jgi:uncharacterized protein
MTMKHLVLALAFAALCGGVKSQPHAIATGPERGTYIGFGLDLATHVAKPVGIDLRVRPSKGSAENVHLLRKEPGVRLALVQSDVYSAFLDSARNGSKEARQIIDPLRVIMPLYDEEVHVVVRADSPLNFVHEIKGQRINVGPVGSGTALTATTLYRAMFAAAPAEANISYLTHDEALLKLSGDEGVDVAIVVATQPSKIFAQMKPQARKFIKLLRMDPNAVESRQALQVYHATNIASRHYPNLLDQDVPALATKTMLVTYDFNIGSTTGVMLDRFAQSLCARMPMLRSQGHAKWKEIKFDLPPLGEGWRYHAGSYRTLSRCTEARMQTTDSATLTSQSECSPEDRLLGLCQNPNVAVRTRPEKTNLLGNSPVANR